MKSVKYFDFNIINSDIIAVVNQLDNYLESLTFRYVVTLNPQILMHSVNHVSIKQIINKADMIIPDGQGIVLGIKLLLGKRLKVITGVQLLYFLLTKGRYRIYFVGAKPAVIDAAASVVKRCYSTIDLCGYSHGYLTEEQQQRVIEDIREKEPDFIFVGMGFPQQDYFIQQCSARCSRGIAIGIGGAFDVLSGRLKLAPNWVKKIRCEWLFRGIQEPHRLLTWGYLLRYILLIIKSFFKKC